MEQTARARSEDRSLRWCVAAVYALAAAVPARALDGLPVLCPFRRHTGLPCPGCGGTHAFAAMAHGQWTAAWAYNPLAAVLFVLGLAWLALAFTAPRHRLLRPGPRAGVWLAAAFLAGSVAFGAWRILSAA
jgi:hypothetical protein